MSFLQFIWKLEHPRVFNLCMTIMSLTGESLLHWTNHIWVLANSVDQRHIQTERHDGLATHSSQAVPSSEYSSDLGFQEIR